MKETFACAPVRCRLWASHVLSCLHCTCDTENVWLCAKKHDSLHLRTCHLTERCTLHIIATPQHVVISVFLLYFVHAWSVLVSRWNLSWCFLKKTWLFATSCHPKAHPPPRGILENAFSPLSAHWSPLGIQRDQPRERKRERERERRKQAQRKWI